MRIVVALGGDTPLGHEAPVTADAQRENAKIAATALAPLALEHELVISHGNGPQMELLVLQAVTVTEGANAQTAPGFTMDVVKTQHEDTFGYLFEQELRDLLPADVPVATILNMVEVDPNDPAFRSPNKFIGPAYSMDEANRIALRTGWAFRRDGDTWRRVVPSPKPGHIFEIRPIKRLLENKTVVICIGGGGILAMYDHNHERALVGVDAIIEKDSANALLARQLSADLLLFATEVDGVYLDWGTPEARLIGRTTPEEIDFYRFDPDSMGPKVRAACEFVQSSGRMAAIGAVDDIPKIVAGEAGTIITVSG
jgi:carbamate kinase